MGSVNQVSGNVVTVQRYLWLDFAVKHVRTRSLLITQYNHSFSETEWVKWCIQMFLKKKKKKEMFLIGSSWQLTITNWQHCSYKLNMESLHVLISRYSGKLNMLGLFAIETSALQGSELWDGSEHWPGCGSKASTIENRMCFPLWGQRGRESNGHWWHINSCT